MLLRPVVLSPESQASTPRHGERLWGVRAPETGSCLDVARGGRLWWDAQWAQRPRQKPRHTCGPRSDVPVTTCERHAAEGEGGPWGWEASVLVKGYLAGVRHSVPHTRRGLGCVRRGEGGSEQDGPQLRVSGCFPQPTGR
ncbi:hypothetical protein PAL_GLEAN10002303 [Pteropus alecto]|uniref:Uncharacterized protein n=2 Tax=Pteropus alecto TaxID=9402 RepID=L5KMZ1_PTEAL|nr:hypothetical protein PAL_GLEAN10002303 [Pteropus alecto]